MWSKFRDHELQQNFARLEQGLPRTNEEVFQGHASFPFRPPDPNLGSESDQRNGAVGGRDGVHNVAADGGHISDLNRPDVCHGVGQYRKVFPDNRRKFQHSVSHQSADPQFAVLEGDLVKALNSPQGDQNLGSDAVDLRQ